MKLVAKIIGSLSVHQVSIIIALLIDSLRFNMQYLIMYKRANAYRYIKQVIVWLSVCTGDNQLAKVDYRL